MKRRSQACQEREYTSSHPQRDLSNSSNRENNSRQAVVSEDFLLSIMARLENLESERTIDNNKTTYLENEVKDLRRVLLSTMARLENLESERTTNNNKIAYLENEVKDLRRVDELSRSKKRADAKIKKMLITDPSQKLYWRAVYHTLKDFFDAYRLAKTKLILPNEEVNETKGRKAVKLISEGASAVLGDIPVLGTIVNYAKDIAKHRIEKSNRKDFNWNTEAVVSFLRYNNDEYAELEEEISLSCYDAAIQLAHIKKDAILDVTNAQTLEKMKNSKKGWFKDFWNLVSEEEPDNMSPVEKAVYCTAVKDVTMILAHIYQHSEEMKNKGDITAQFIDIVRMS